MKKTCDKCRALTFSGLMWKCGLGYKTEETKHRGVFMGLVPLEQCPKPLTLYKMWKEVITNDQRGPLQGL